MKKLNWSDILGKISVYYFFISLYIMNLGIRNSVYLGILSLIIKKLIYKEKIEIGPKILAYSNLGLYLSMILIDVYFYNVNGSLSSIKILNKFWLYFILINFIKNKEELIKCFIALTISIFISFIGAVPYIKSLLENPNVRIRSFNSIMVYSHMMAAATIFLIGGIFYSEKKYNKLIYLCMSVVSFLLVILTKTRGAILAMLGALVLLLLINVLINKKFKETALIGLIVLTTLFVIPSNLKEPVYNRFRGAKGSNQARLDLWQASIHGIQNNTLIGVGYSGTTKSVKEYIEAGGQMRYNRYIGNSHNAYLAILFKYGILVGGYQLIYLLLVMPILWTKKYKVISKDFKEIYTYIPVILFSFYISMLTENVIYSSSTSYILIVSLSIFGFVLMDSKKNMDKV